MEQYQTPNFQVSDLIANEQIDLVSVLHDLRNVTRDALKSYGESYPWAANIQASILHSWSVVNTNPDAAHLLRRILADLPPSDFVANLSKQTGSKRNQQLTELVKILLDFLSVDLSEINFRPLIRILDFLVGYFHQTGNLLAIDEGILRAKLAWVVIRDDAQNRFYCATKLMNTYLKRHRRSGDDSDVAQALWFLHQATALLVSHIDDSSIDMLYTLGEAFYSSALGQHHPALVSSGSLILKHIYLAQIKDEKKANIAEGLASLHCSGSDDDPAHLSLALGCHEQALHLAENGRSNNPVWLSHIGWHYRRRFDTLRNEPDLENALLNLHKSNDMMENDHPLKIFTLRELAECLVDRFEHTNAASDLQQSIQLLERGLAIASEDDERAKILATLAPAHGALFRRLGNESDLDSAIVYFDKLCLLNYDAPVALSGLSKSYHVRYQLLGNSNDLDQSISCNLQALSLADDKDPAKRIILLNTATYYMQRFNDFGHANDIDSLVSYQDQALGLQPAESLNQEVHVAANHGVLFHFRFSRLGKLKDIEWAINSFLEATRLASATHTQKPFCLSGLGTAYMNRYRRFGEKEDIERAVNAHKQALLYCPRDYPTIYDFFHILGATLGERFQRYGVTSDIKEAIDYSLQAVSLLPEDHRDRPLVLSGLRNLYFLRFQSFNEGSDLDQAIIQGMLAVSLVSDSHTWKPRLLCDLGDTYFAKSQLSPRDEDIDQAISLHRQSLGLTQDGDQDISNRLISLGRSLLCRYGSTGELSNLVEAGNVFRKGALSLSSPPSSRFLSAAQWSELSTSSESPDALQACNVGMQLLSQVAWLGASVESRYREIAQNKNIVIKAVMAGIDAKQYGLALKWLEQGRSIVWKQLIQLRTPLDDLRLIDPNLADRFEQVSSNLERAETGLLDGSIGFSQESHGQKHRRLAQEWTDVLGQVRSVPEFQSFLEPHDPSELVKSAHSSSVVILSTHFDGCHALVIRQGSQAVEYLSLPNMTLDQATFIAHRIKESLSTVKARGDDRGVSKGTKTKNHFKPVLISLWISIVKPVLDFLDYYTDATPATELPRITWCCTGPLVFLPLHAAGDYTLTGTGPRVFHYVISSYAPTLTSLLPRPNRLIQFTGILAVSQPHTPGLSALPGALEEVQGLIQVAGNQIVTQLSGELATADTVVHEMKHHSWIHLACHASQDLKNPRMSAIKLHESVLTLGELARHRLESPDFAFLSACETATGDQTVPDEAVHLAAGVLIAGYQSVIATMWRIQDSEAPLVSNTIYRNLFKSGKPDSSKSSAALHEAMIGLRDRVGEGEFDMWVPYVHMGV